MTMPRHEVRRVNNFLIFCTVRITIQAYIDLFDPTPSNFLQNMLIIFCKFMTENEQCIILLAHLSNEALIRVVQIGAMLYFCEFLMTLPFRYE